MLKWTIQQKFATTDKEDNDFGGLFETPPVKPRHSLKRKRRSTVSNKENMITSTPLAKPPSRAELFQEFLKISPKPLLGPPECKTPLQYASTLPKFEEEYSPPTAIVPGPVIAMRGLVPDAYLRNRRYLANANSEQDEQQNLPKRQKTTKEVLPGEKQQEKCTEEESLSSSKMGDVTLDNLISAILDSAKKNTKRKTRRSLNLRRRTLLRNTSTAVGEILSPSYTRADDPASDLNLSFSDVKSKIVQTDKECGEHLEGSNKCKKRCRKDSEVQSNKYFEVGVALPSIYV